MTASVFDLKASDEKENIPIKEIDEEVQYKLQYMI